MEINQILIDNQTGSVYWIDGVDLFQAPITKSGLIDLDDSCYIDETLCDDEELADLGKIADKLNLKWH